MYNHNYYKVKNDLDFSFHNEKNKEYLCICCIIILFHICYLSLVFLLFQSNNWDNENNETLG